MRLGLAPVLSALVVLLAAGCGGDGSGAASLEGTLWVLASGPGQGEGAEGGPNATFDSGAIEGSTGCNRYSGEYTVDGDALEIGPLAVTQMACASPPADVEQAYLAALDAVTGWSVDDDELVLSGDDGELLRYVPGVP